MPTYEYACAKCGHQFEKVQPIASKALTTCLKDDCGMKKWGKGKVKRQISAGGGLLFKGTGFYITDYRSEGYKAAAKKDSNASSGGTKSATTETKPAKTEAPKSEAPKAKAPKK